MADAPVVGGDFRVGDVLSRAWSVFTGNIIFFLAVPLLLNGISYLFNLALGRVYAFFGIALPPGMMPGTLGLPPGAWGTIFVVSMIAGIIALCLYMIGQGVLLMGAFQRLRGEPLRVGTALQRALARFLPLIGVAILIVLAIFSVALVCGLVVLALGFVLGKFAALLMFGVAAPIVFILVIWSVVVPACLVEGLGPIASMVRSAELTRGYRWKIVGIMLLFGLIAIAILIVLGTVIALTRSPVAVGIVQVAGNVVLTGYVNCATIMIYHDLRVAKEGIDTGQIAAMFD